MASWFDNSCGSELLHVMPVAVCKRLADAGGHDADAAGR